MSVPTHPGLSPDEVPTGNTFDKYNAENPIFRRIIENFEATLGRMWDRAAPRSLLDVGCGEGVLLHEWARKRPDARFVGVDLDDPKLRAEWSRRQAPNLEYRVGQGERLDFADDEFDVVTAIEVLEHVQDPEATLAEMARVGKRYLLVSVPREPIWRMLNMARGAYWSALGNTPGHLNHWSKRSFTKLLGRFGEVVETASPFPWTMLLVRLPGADAVERAEGIETPAGSEVATTQEYSRAARIVASGVGATGLVTFAYFSVSSHVLTPEQHARIGLLWSIMFVVVTIVYRPIEQLLARSIAARRAQDLESHPLRNVVLIQATFALGLLALGLVFRGPLQDDVFNGSSALYWILVVGVVTYAASYFARGWLAGNGNYLLYGGLMLFESSLRFLFAFAVALGLASGQTTVAVGMAIAPLVSLVLVPLAFRRRAAGASAALEAAGGDTAPEPRRGSGSSEGVAGGELSLRHGTGFALAVLAIMLAEQTLVNAPVLAVEATTTNAALAGFIFNMLLIARAPLQLFQSVQASLLPHLAGLEATDGVDDFRKAVRGTIIAIAVFAVAVAIGLLLLGPFAMDVFFGSDDQAEYSRFGLALLGLGMGFHLIAGTLNQAALARRQARAAAGAWLVVAVLYVAWMLADVIEDEFARTQVGYFGAAALLTGLLWILYRRGPSPRPGGADTPAERAGEELLTDDAGVAPGR